MNKNALILVNVGTPDEPKVSSVRKYLFQFLNDKRVIDLPWLLRKILVNLIIVPFRAPKSTKLYEMLWQDKGSPLLFHSVSLRDKLQKKINDYDVFVAMRYGNPNLKDVLDKIRANNYQNITIFPMFPQYASSTTGSLLDFALKEISNWEVIPEIKTIDQFYDNEHFIDAFAENISKYDLENYDHIIFSYHGLPLSQINSIHPQNYESKCTCHISMPEHGNYCYKATCYETTRLLNEKLNIPEDKFSIGFQSRLTKKWLKPFTDEIIQQKAKEGCKRILITAPAFVTDCLETIVELGVEYDELFKDNGGEELKMVPSLNDSAKWVEAIQKIINSQ